MCVCEATPPVMTTWSVNEMDADRVGRVRSSPGYSLAAESDCDGLDGLLKVLLVRIVTKLIVKAWEAASHWWEGGPETRPAAIGPFVDRTLILNIVLTNWWKSNTNKYLLLNVAIYIRSNSRFWFMDHSKMNRLVFHGRLSDKASTFRSTLWTNLWWHLPSFMIFYS